MPLILRLIFVLFHEAKGYLLGFAQSGMGMVSVVVTLRIV